MNRPQQPRTKIAINSNVVQESLDKSRKHMLWRRSNYLGILVIIAFVLLATARLVNDIRGEYTSDNPRLGHVRLSVEHRDGKIKCMLIIPKTHPFLCQVKDENVKGDVEWPFKDSYAAKGATPVYFKGKVNIGDGTISGVLQDGINVYPISFKRDDFASLSRQMLTAIPGAG
jgi:hypothetical protein